jgi:hypothetical protein
MLAGCGGGSQALIGQSATPKQLSYEFATAAPLVNRLLSLYGETFTGTRVHRTCHTDGQGFGKLSFKAYGNATGPVTGTFEARGVATIYCTRGCQWHFKETFTIISSYQSVSGVATSDSFGIGCDPPNTDLTADYVLKHGQQDYGTTSVILENHSFSETFQ